MEFLTDNIAQLSGVGGFLISTIIAIFKWIKAKKELNTEKRLTLIKEYIMQFIDLAEKYVKNGQDKKQYVLNQIRIKCQHLKINYDKYIEIFDNEIEQLIALTNAVNINKTEDKNMAQRTIFECDVCGHVQESAMHNVNGKDICNNCKEKFDTVYNQLQQELTENTIARLKNGSF